MSLVSRPSRCLRTASSCSCFSSQLRNLFRFDAVQGEPCLVVPSRILFVSLSVTQASEPNLSMVILSIQFQFSPQDSHLPFFFGNRVGNHATKSRRPMHLISLEFYWVRVYIENGIVSIVRFRLRSQQRQSGEPVELMLDTFSFVNSTF